MLLSKGSNCRLSIFPSAYPNKPQVKNPEFEDENVAIDVILFEKKLKVCLGLGSFNWYKQALFKFSPWLLIVFGNV